MLEKGGGREREREREGITIRGKVARLCAVSCEEGFVHTIQGGTKWYSHAFLC